MNWSAVFLQKSAYWKLFFDIHLKSQLLLTLSEKEVSSPRAPFAHWARTVAHQMSHRSCTPDVKFCTCVLKFKSAVRNSKSNHYAGKNLPSRTNEVASMSLNLNVWGRKTVQMEKVRAIYNIITYIKRRIKATIKLTFYWKINA